MPTDLLRELLGEICSRWPSLPQLPRLCCRRKRQPGRALFHRSTGRSESIRRRFGRYLRVSWPQAVRLAALRGIGF
jgi:hypothetical protein